MVKEKKLENFQGDYRAKTDLSTCWLQVYKKPAFLKLTNRDELCNDLAKEPFFELHN